MAVEVFVQGRRVVLNESSDFRAKGGEGAVYVKGGTAYKMYADPAAMFPEGKLDELAALERPTVLRPLALARDRRGAPVGYTMRSLEGGVVLCRMFPKAFRAKHRLAPDRALHLVRRLQDGVAYIHSRGILLVDLNELNFLLDRDLREVYFIDVNSYQTRSYPATALMESVRDRQCGGVFTELSDWFSFAVVSFQVFVGIHPYKGSHPRHGGPAHWMEHMERNLSVLNPAVSVPSTCLPFDAIPQAYRDWYRAVLEEGKRLPPPRAPQAVVVIAVPRDRAGSAGTLFRIEEVAEFPEEILTHCDGLTLTTGGVYSGKTKVMDAPGDACLGFTPRLRRPLIAWVESGKARVHDRGLKAPASLDLAAEALMAHGGCLYAKQGMSLLRLAPVELADRTLIGAMAVGNVTARSTALFEGGALLSLLGGFHALLFPTPGECRSVRLPELDGHTLLDARAARNVLVVAAEQGGRYQRFVFRFDPECRAYDCRTVPDAAPDVNLAALDTGVCLLMGENDELEVFSARTGDPNVKALRDPALGGDARLFARGGQALFARGRRLYRFTMRGT
ncbi:MAG: serine/threonine protein kinase [Armatimonadetes bacterium]|nr:serine/threonine protein kinase [Armatimonadota bacterium]